MIRFEPGYGRRRTDQGRIVALRATGLGDLLLVVPALRALRRRFPAHEIVLACPGRYSELVDLFGAVDGVIHSNGQGSLGQVMEEASLTVNLHGPGTTSRSALATAPASRTITFALPGCPAPQGAPVWRPGENERARWCRLLDECGIPADAADFRLPLPPLKVPNALRGASVIHPGAAFHSQTWPAKRWAQIARMEAEEGRTVVITGDAREAPMATEIASKARLDPSSVLAGATTLPQLAALIGQAGRIACGDTGVGHLAVALGTPSVQLFGAASPEEWGPPPELRYRHRVITADRRQEKRSGDGSGLMAIDAPVVADELRRLPDVRSASR
ncbi:MAG: glycosyltransferase family 9 protein [Pseudomonadota bacterium]